MNVGQKVNQMRTDLAKIVNLCNSGGDYRLANVAQTCLQQIGSLSQQLGEGTGQAVGDSEFNKAKPSPD